MDSTESPGADTSQGGRKATDSSKNEQYGDAGRAKTKAEKQVAALQAKADAATGRERKKLLQKIKNVNLTAEKKKKGTNHSGGGGNGGKKGGRGR